MGREEAIPAGVRERRRIEVAEATAKLISTRGLEAVRVREIANELGCSTHVVSHYFDNKKDLLLFALRQSAARQLQRLKVAIGQNLSIAECLECFLPLDEVRSIDAHVWLVFWGESISDSDYIEVQKDFGQRWRRLMIGMMKIRGYFDDTTSREIRGEIAQQLQTAIAGVSVHGTLGVWSAEEQKAALRRQVSMIIGILDEKPAEAAQPPAQNTETTGAETSDMAALAQENARLRKMLVDAMLQNEILSGQSGP